MKLDGVNVLYLTEMTLSTSFFTSWKVLMPRERSIRSENRHRISMCSAPAAETLEDEDKTALTSVQFPVGVTVHVFDWTVCFQGLEQQRETFWFNPLRKEIMNRTESSAARHANMLAC